MSMRRAWAFSALLLLTLLAASLVAVVAGVVAVAADDSSSGASASSRHFTVDARDVLVSLFSFACLSAVQDSNPKRI